METRTNSELRILELEAELDNVRQVQFPAKLNVVAKHWQNKVDALQLILDSLQTQVDLVVKRNEWLEQELEAARNPVQDEVKENSVESVTDSSDLPSFKNMVYTTKHMILNRWEDYEIHEFERCLSANLIRYHHTLGQWIRNEFKLWARPWAKEIDEQGVDMSPNHPDAISMEVIREVSRELNRD